MQQLDDRDQAILNLEGQRFKHGGAKDTAIRDTFDMSPTRYYQVLAALLDEPAALAHDPMLVKRLQRLRDQRRLRRSQRRLGAG